MYQLTLGADLAVHITSSKNGKNLIADLADECGIEELCDLRTKRYIFSHGRVVEIECDSSEHDVHLYTKPVSVEVDLFLHTLHFSRFNGKIGFYVKNLPLNMQYAATGELVYQEWKDPAQPVSLRWFANGRNARIRDCISVHSNRWGNEVVIGWSVGVLAKEGKGGK